MILAGMVIALGDIVDDAIIDIEKSCVACDNTAPRVGRGRRPA